MPLRHRMTTAAIPAEFRAGKPLTASRRRAGSRAIDTGRRDASMQIRSRSSSSLYNGCPHSSHAAQSANRSVLAPSSAR
jgi:hypothetical protein